uniref:helix-turn-helix domain-containing protein n=1 Tax=Photorhabdus sp. RM322S TaxID=3342825 RepID=UPI0036DD0983
MSMNLMAHVMSVKVGNPLRKLILLKLADNANDQGECWPSVPYIAEQCEMSERSVQNHIKQLVKDGFLWIEERKSENGLNKSNVYHLTLGHGVRNSGANAAPYDEFPAPPGANAAPVSGAGAAPRTSHSLEPVKEPVTPIVPKGGDVEKVFSFWQQTMDHKSAKLDAKRRKRIAARLAEKFTYEQLCKVITGATYDPWLMGKNPQNRRYDGIDTLLRDAAQVERLIALSDNEHAIAVSCGKYSGVTARNIQNMQSWIQNTGTTGAPF